MAEEETTKKSEETKAVNGEVPLLVILRKSIIANGEETKELRFREPTAGDIERCGNPVNIDMIGSDTPKVTFDAKAMSHMMSLLAAVPPSSIKQMHPRDWNTAAWTLASFFMPEW